MRFQKHALNNDSYDQDYLAALRCKKVGKNVSVHRSVVISDPEKLSIGNDVVIEAFTVILDGYIEIGDGVTIGAHAYIKGNVKIEKDVPHATEISGEVFVPEEELPKERPLAKPVVWGEANVGKSNTAKG